MHGYWNYNVSFLEDSSWEIHMRKREVTIERRNSLQIILCEALIPFDEEHPGLLKLQVPLGWEWGRFE